MKTSIPEYNTNFSANIKLTPTVKKMVLELNPKRQNRFIDVQRKLMSLEAPDELLLTRRVSQDGKKIPVIINLTTGAMVAHFNHKMSKLSKAALELLEKIADIHDPLSKTFFNKNKTVIEDSRNLILTKTHELSTHPVAANKLKQIQLDEKNQLLMRKYEKTCPKKEVIFNVSENEKLFIKNFDEGYIYYLCNEKNMPNGRYFTVTYNKDGFQINYNENLLPKDKVEKYFQRYTKKGIEKASE